MLLVSDYNVIIEPARSIIITLQIVLGIGCLLISIMAFLTFKKKDPNMSRTYFFGIPLVFLLISIARFILVYHDYYASDDLDLVLWALANIIVLGGLITLNYIIETTVYPKTKHIFTIVGISLTTLYLIFVPLNKPIASIILYAATASQFIPPMGIYLIVAKNAAGDVRTKALIIIVGLLILVVSQSTGLFEFVGILDRVTASIVAPPSALIGLSILGYGFIRMSD